VLFFNLL